MERILFYPDLDSCVFVLKAILFIRSQQHDLMETFFKNYFFERTTGLYRFGDVDQQATTFRAFVLKFVISGETEYSG